MLALFHIDDARDEYPGIGGDQPPRLEDEIDIEAARQPRHDCAIGGRIRRRRIVETIGHAKSAAEIGAGDGMAVFAEHADQFDHPREGRLERRKLGDLAADMDVDADDCDAGQIARISVDAAGAVPRNAEFRFGRAGRDLGVRARIDVRVDAQRDRRAFSHIEGDGVQRQQLRLAFDIELMDAGFESEPHFPLRFPDAGEDDARGRNSRRQCLLEFAARNHVGARAEPRQRL